MPRLVFVALLLAACQTPGPRRFAKTRVVLNGIDVLEATGYRALDGARVGLITNHTGLDQNGASTPVLLQRAENVHLVALFSPEHGFQGRAEGHVGDAKHKATGLPIYSLYTKERAPNARHLQGIDTLVFDIQDIGCRFYTYISTMGEAMVVASKQKLRFVVLDRPNPINGVDFGGPMRDADKKSFIAWHDIPVRHGMTVGELARMFHAELDLTCRLDVVKLRGWRRAMYFDETGQMWVDPSPNMRSPTQALLYPGIGLVEFTNVSVGRGTDTPFEWIGAPWIDGRKLAAALNDAAIPGLRCVPVQFTPTASRYKGKRCQGAEFLVVDRRVFDPLRLGLELAVALRRLHRGHWQLAKYTRLLANDAAFRQVERATDAASILAATRSGAARFGARRSRYLLY